MDYKWKLLEHKELKMLGAQHNLFLDLISKKYRKSKYLELVRIKKETSLLEAGKLGCKFSDKMPPNALWEVFYEKIYFVDEFLPKPGQVVIDVGAYVGDTAIWYAKAFGAKVIAFEPLKDNFEILEENIALNNVLVEAYNIALGSGESSGFVMGKTMMIKGNDKQIQTKKLDDFQLKECHILKIDAEGFEYDVLKGAVETIKRCRPKIILETHSKDLKEKCHYLLKDLGYSLKYKGRKVKPKNSWMNEVINLFYSPD